MYKLLRFWCYCLSYFFKRTRLSNTVPHGTDENTSIALQPANSTGSVFSTACWINNNGEYGNVKIFDIRRSVSGKLALKTLYLMLNIPFYMSDAAII